MLQIPRCDLCLAQMKRKGTVMTKAHTGGKELPVSALPVNGTAHML